MKKNFDRNKYSGLKFQSQIQTPGEDIEKKLLSLSTGVNSYITELNNQLSGMNSQIACYKDENGLITSDSIKSKLNSDYNLVVLNKDARLKLNLPPLYTKSKSVKRIIRKNEIMEAAFKEEQIKERAPIDYKRLDKFALKKKQSIYIDRIILIDLDYHKFDNDAFFYNLEEIQQYRREIIESIKEKKTLDVDFNKDVLTHKNEAFILNSKLETKLEYEKNKNKLKSDLVSRSSVNNTVYSILALNQQNKTKLMSKLDQILDPYSHLKLIN